MNIAINITINTKMAESDSEWLIVGSDESEDKLEEEKEKEKKKKTTTRKKKTSRTLSLLETWAGVERTTLSTPAQTGYIEVLCRYPPPC